MFVRLVAILKSQNTHLTWWVGVIGTSLVLCMFLGGKSRMENWDDAHLGVFAVFADSLIEGIAEIALYAWFLPLIALALGRPVWIRQRGGPLTVIAKDVH